MPIKYSLIIRIIRAIKRALAKKNYPKFILTVWKKSQLHKDWASSIDGFDAISVKVLDGSSKFQLQEAAAVLVEAAHLNLEHHGWGFHYCLTKEKAKKEASAAADLCKKMNLVGYHWNAEKQWAAIGDPEATAIEFAEQFKLLAPNVKLFANCFSSKVTSEMMEVFDYYEPMIYGTRVSTISKKFKNRWSAPSIRPDQRCAMVGTGRKNPRNPKQAWGYTHSTGNDSSESGLDRLVRDYKPTYLNYFRAGVIGGEDIMMESNDINPTLSQQIKVIKKSIRDEQRTLKRDGQRV